MAVAYAAAAVGTIMSAAGQRAQYGGEIDAANYRAGVARNNAIIGEQNARYAEKTGAIKADVGQMRTVGTVGGERAAYSASGIDTSKGTALSVQEDSAKLGALDVETIRNNAARVAYGSRISSLGYVAESGLEGRAAGFSREAGNLGVMGSLIGGAGSLASRWASYQEVGGNTDYPG